jgi:hypothetical protein
MTKETIKTTYLDPIAKKQEMQWHQQEVHKLAAAVWILDKLDIKDQAKRDSLLKAWGETPSSFGCNCSAMGQSLGRITGRAKIEKTFAGF